MSVKTDLRSYEKPQVETAHGTSLAPRIEEPTADGAFLVTTIHQIRCITRGPTNHELIQSSTVFIRISAQPRISAHPSSSQSNSNKRSPQPHPLD